MTNLANLKHVPNPCCFVTNDPQTGEVYTLSVDVGIKRLEGYDLSRIEFVEYGSNDPLKIIVDGVTVYVLITHHTYFQIQGRLYHISPFGIDVDKGRTFSKCQVGWDTLKNGDIYQGCFEHNYVTS